MMRPRLLNFVSPNPVTGSLRNKLEEMALESVES